MHNLLMLGGCGMLSTLLRCTVLRTHLRIVIIICTWARNRHNKYQKHVVGTERQITTINYFNFPFLVGWSATIICIPTPVQSLQYSCTGALNSPVAQFPRNNDDNGGRGWYHGGDEGCFHPEKLNPE